LTESTAQALTGLAARLTKPEDRETYSGLISYFHSLPDHDELFHIAELLGLLSLLGQRLPDALGEFLAELREQTKASAAYHSSLDTRLAGLPQEIAAGVNMASIAKEMGEALRQQITATGLENAANLLRGSSREITALSSHISATLKPLSNEYRTISSTISSALTKLTEAAGRLENHNARLFEQERKNARLWQAMLALVLFLSGGLCGMEMEKRQTADDLANIYSQFQRVQTPQVPPIAPKKVARQNRRAAETP
jgi:chromosome segregation ATPase